MQIKYIWLAGVVVVSQLATPSLRAEDTNTLEIIKQLQQRIGELEQKVKALEAGKGTGEQIGAGQGQTRIEELDQKVKNLERKRQKDAEAAEAKARQAPSIIVGENGFGLASADTNFVLQLKGVLQVDSRTFFNDGGNVGNDGFLLRRARPILQGTLFRDFDFLFVPDFGGSSAPQIFDAYMNYRYSPALQLQAGKAKPPIGLEQLQADVNTLFNERGLPTDLVPNRDVGFELHGDLLTGSISYAVGLFNGVGDGRNSSNVDFEDDKSVAGRFFISPFATTSLDALKGFGFGLGASFESMQTTNTVGLPNNTSGSLSTPGYLTAGQQQFFAYNPTNRSVVADGDHWRLAPQTAYYYGPLGLLGEYTISDQRVSLAGAGPQRSARLANTGWQIAGSWVLTGEDASFNGVIPRHPFDLRGGGWGAWQLVARYSELDIDPAAFPLYANPNTSARAAHEWSVGLNWYLNRNLRFDVSYSHTDFTGGGGAGASAPATVTRQPESVLFTRFQLAF